VKTRSDPTDEDGSMEETGRAFLKWSLAIIVLAGICLYAIQNIGPAFRSGIAFGDDASESPSGPEGGGAVTNGEAFPEVDFSLVNNVVGFYATDGMEIGPGPLDGLVLSFPLIPGDPNCVQTARVEIPIRAATPAQLALYPSAIPDLAALGEGVPTGDAVSIPLSTPPLTDTAANPAALVWDVGQLYRTWAMAGDFEGTPAPTDPSAFTVVIRPNDQGVSGRLIAVASSESADPRPRLIWEGTPGCGSSPSPTPTTTTTPV
jgi:hypothetical protein